MGILGSNSNAIFGKDEEEDNIALLKSVLSQMAAAGGVVPAHLKD